MRWEDEVNEILTEPTRRCVLIKTPVLELTHETRTGILNELGKRPVWEVMASPMQAMPIDGKTMYVAEITYLTRGKTAVSCTCLTDATDGLVTDVIIWNDTGTEWELVRTCLFEAVRSDPDVTV